MARFAAYIPVNMISLKVLNIISDSNTQITVSKDKHDLKAELGNVVVDLHSTKNDPFSFSNTGPTGGTLSSIEVDVNGTLAYKFTGVSVSFKKLAMDVHAGHLKGALDLILAGNDRVTGSHGNDLLAGGPGDDIFVFAKPFGHDHIVDFTQGQDKIAISHKIFDDIGDVQAHSHLDKHGHVVIKVDAHDTLTLDTVHNVTDLTMQDFLFT